MIWTYATPEDVQAYLAAADIAHVMDDEIADALAAAHATVDSIVGGPRDLLTGRALDPAVLQPAQVEALRRGCCAVAGQLLIAGWSTRHGDADYLTGDVQVLLRARPHDFAAAITELAGLRLLRRSGCARPDDLAV